MSFAYLLLQTHQGVGLGMDRIGQHLVFLEGTQPTARTLVASEALVILTAPAVTRMSVIPFGVAVLLGRMVIISPVSSRSLSGGE